MDPDTDAACWCALFASNRHGGMPPFVCAVFMVRVLLRRGAGIGVPADDYTPYTGRPREEIIQTAVRKYLESH